MASFIQKAKTLKPQGIGLVVQPREAMQQPTMDQGVIPSPVPLAKVNRPQELPKVAEPQMAQQSGDIIPTPPWSSQPLPASSPQAPSISDQAPQRQADTSQTDLKNLIRATLAEVMGTSGTQPMQNSALLQPPVQTETLDQPTDVAREDPDFQFKQSFTPAEERPEGPAEMAPQEPAPRVVDESFSPIERSIQEKTSNFYLNIGEQAETDHGDIPVATNDAAEKDKPIEQRTRDIGFGHKIKPSEDSSGMIHGIRFKNEDGTFIPLTEEQKIEILNKDMEAELSLARSSGWDTKLRNIGTSWDDLDYKYKNALTSLAFNTGGSNAGEGWTAVLTAAKNEDPVAFAKEMRRKDAGRNTAGMDNRVLKELYYSGIISNRSEVSSVLPLGDKRSGVPR